MNPKIRFALKAALTSIALFAVWPWVSKIYAFCISTASSALRVMFGMAEIDVLKEKFSLFLIPALSLIIAATVRRERKIAYSALLIGVFLSFDITFQVTGGTDIAEGGGNFGRGFVSSTVTVLYHTLAWVLPVMVALLFIRGRPETFWEPDESPESHIRKCPICGEVKTGLKDHIRAAHGEASLRSKKVKRALARAGK